MKILNLTKPNMLQMLHIIDDWHKQFHIDKGVTVFQNKELLSNVRFNQHSLNTISKNSKGFENIPDTLINPDEVWSFWKDPKNQLDTMRNYISFGGKYNYVVQTENGFIHNAFLLLPSETNKYRIGCFMIK